MFDLKDPLLFSGTLRFNLDPFSEYSDKEVWTALTQAHLDAFIRGVPEQLSYEVGESGESIRFKVYSYS